MPEHEIADLLTAYAARYRELRKDDRIRHIVLFKNQGARAGGSLEHPHSQIYGLPLVPFEVNIRLREMERYHDLNDRCLLCDIIADERASGERVIYENDCFLAVMPYADLSPYHFWIMPKFHSPSFALITETAVAGLAAAMRDTFGRMFTLLRNPDFNFVIQSLSHYGREKTYFHWYMSVIPQIKQKGGLEYAGGFYVNSVLPETAAAEMRGSPLPDCAR
jgi:UDPglucose--hexose-1-phosphate uridylyltransferase